VLAVLPHRITKLVTFAGNEVPKPEFFVVAGAERGNRKHVTCMGIFYRRFSHPLE
jgi:hypothetical protein